MERLAATVGQINNVSNLIRDVAAQTNLLAHDRGGAGFAAVAQEVKTLAAQTEKATGDITEQISSIEVTTSSVVQAMRTIAETIYINATEISVAVGITGLRQQGDCPQRQCRGGAHARSIGERGAGIGRGR